MMAKDYFQPGDVVFYRPTLRAKKRIGQVIKIRKENWVKWLDGSGLVVLNLLIKDLSLTNILLRKV